MRHTRYRGIIACAALFAPNRRRRRSSVACFAFGAAHKANCSRNGKSTTEVLHQILTPIGDDLIGFRDRARLLVGFAGALPRSELAAVRVEYIEALERGLRLALPCSKGDRTGSGVIVAIAYGATDASRSSS